MKRPTPNILGQTVTASDDVALAMGSAPTQEIIAPFSYDDLDAETRIVVRQRTGEIKALMRQTAQGVMDIGEKLIEVKSHLDHGQFGGWLDAEFGWSERTAQNFMAVARRFKSANFADLTIAPSALYLLAGQSVPEPARQEAIQRATNGQPVTHKEARQIVAQHRPAPPKPSPVPPPPPAQDEEDAAPDDLYTVVHRWLAGRFSNDQQRRFALLDLLRSKTASQYWPSMARLLPSANTAEILMILDAVRSEIDGATPAAPAPAPLPAPPVDRPAPARIDLRPPAPKPVAVPAEQRLEHLRRRLADLLSLPYTASDEELLDAVESAVIARQLSEEAAQ